MEDYRMLTPEEWIEYAHMIPRWIMESAYENDTLEIGSKKLRVLETPGHSLGGVCYICDEEKFVFSGDTLFKLTVGRTDLWGGNLNELLDSVEKLMLLSDDYEVFTGHNISTTIGSERVRNRYLRKKRI